MDEDYDIVPHRQISDLKRQMDELKTKSHGASSTDLTQSMSALTKSMDGMLRLFSEAAQELKVEGHEEEAYFEKLNPLNDKLDKIIEQNKIIAEGMVAVSDMLRDFIEEQRSKPDPIPPLQSAPAPRPSMPYQAPPSQPSMPSAPFDDLSAEPKKGGGLFKRARR